jgi:hypothetical protein
MVKSIDNPTKVLKHAIDLVGIMVVVIGVEITAITEI